MVGPSRRGSFESNRGPALRQRPRRRSPRPVLVDVMRRVGTAVPRAVRVNARGQNATRRGRSAFRARRPSISPGNRRRDGQVFAREIAQSSSSGGVQVDSHACTDRPVETRIAMASFPSFLSDAPDVIAGLVS